ncbi:hypothetical protein ABK040_007365 [Willaertia magna]
MLIILIFVTLFIIYNIYQFLYNNNENILQKNTQNTQPIKNLQNNLENSNEINNLKESLQKKLKKLQKKNKSQTILLQKDEENIELYQKIEDLENNCKTLQNYYNEKSQQLEDTKNKMFLLEKTLQNLQSDLENKKFIEKTQKNDTTDQNVLTLQKKITDLQNEIVNFTEKENNYKNQLEELNKKLQEYKKVALVYKKKFDLQNKKEEIKKEEKIEMSIPEMEIQINCLQKGDISNLEIENIKLFELPEMDILQLTNIIATCPHLKTLKIDNNNLNIKIASALFLACSQSKTIEIVDFSGENKLFQSLYSDNMEENNIVFSSEYKTLALTLLQLITVVNNLKEVRLRGFHFHSIHLKEILRAMSLDDSIEVFDLEGFSEEERKELDSYCEKSRERNLKKGL